MEAKTGVVFDDVAGIEEAKEEKDETLDALLAAKNSNGAPLIKREVRYLIPVLHLKTEWDGSTCTSCEVIDKEAKVLIAKPTLLKAINKIVTGRQYQNDTENGIADRVKGYNLILSKTGKGLSTEYDASGWNEPYEMEEVYYELKNIPDVVKITEEMKRPDDHLESVICNYLYGDEIIPYKKEENEKPAKPTRRRAAKKEETKPTRRKTDKKTEKPTSRRKSRRGKSVIDAAADYSEEDMDELDNLN